jgi:hypothetical protein
MRQTHREEVYRETRGDLTIETRAFPAHSGVHLIEVLDVRLRRRVAGVLEQRRTVSQSVCEVVR